MWILFLLYPFLEIYTLIQVGGRIGFFNTLFALLFAFVLGLGLIRSQGRYLVSRVQQSLAKGEVPARDVLGRLMVLFGGILLMIPGFLSDAFAVLLILPGSRHLLLALFAKQMAKKMSGPMGAGNFRVFTFGAGFPPPYSRPDSSMARDVTPKVIDVTPISSETRRPE